MEHRWYVVHTYSGYEQKVKKALEDKIRFDGMEGFFTEVLVPSEDVLEIKKGVKKTTTRKVFPGYILVKMEMTDEAWRLVKDTPKVSGFIGGTRNPPSIPDEEVMRLTKRLSEGTLEPRREAIFEKGESIRVVDGPFTNFNGIIDEVKPDKGKAKVLVSIFGRSTPVELDFAQLEKN